MTNNNDKKILNVPPLRFPGFSGEWRKCTIGELTIKVGSGVTPRGGEAVYKTEGHPFVRSQNVGLGHLLLDDIAYIDEDTPTNARRIQSYNWMMYCSTSQELLLVVVQS